MGNNLKTQWRVEAKIRGKWVKASGLFETRARARSENAELRDAYGFGKTRIRPYIKA